jgi:hypothetical protein
MKLLLIFSSLQEVRKMFIAMMKKRSSKKFRANRPLIKKRMENNIDILIKYWIIFRVKILMKIVSIISLSAYKFL